MSVSFMEHLLPDFYRSAEHPGHWCHVLDRIKDELQVGSVVVQKFKQNGNRLRQQWVLRDSLSTRDAESHDCLVNNEENPRLELDRSSLPLRGNAVFRDDKRADGVRRAEFLALEQRQAMLGLGCPIILRVSYAEDSSVSMLLHPHSEGGCQITHRHARFLHQLAPHLKQAVSLYERLGESEQQAATLSHCLEQFYAGVFILNTAGELRWANGRARQLLRQTRHLAVAGDQLRCAKARDQSLLAELLASAAACREPGERFVGAVGPSWDSPLQLLAVPVLTAREPCLALYVSEQGSRVDLSAQEVVRLFGLTPAEARLAIALCEGASLNEYAGSRAVSVGTARIQLKSVFSKLGLNRQSELVRLLGSSITARTCGQ